MSKEKQIAINRIKRAVEQAMEDGFRVVVSSDPEGNSWNRIDPRYMEYGDTNEKYIALGVIEYIDENEVFDGMGDDIIENYQKKEAGRIINK